MSTSSLFLPNFLFGFISGSPEALHGVLIEELEQNGLTILLDALSFVCNVLMKILELGDGPQIELILDGL